MDLKKIFLKDACPTSMGGQAVMDGVAMKGPEKSAIVVRVQDGGLHIKTYHTAKGGKWQSLPLLRGVMAFIKSIREGVDTLTYSANVLEYYERLKEEGRSDKEGEKQQLFQVDMASEESDEKSSQHELPETVKESKNRMEGFLTFAVVIFAIVVSLFIFAMLPTMVAALFKPFTSNSVILNLIEGVVRLVFFIMYIWIISFNDDIKTTYQYHGAEHKVIHCYENNLPLTVENAREFLTLHPRCGTSFLMFVMLVSLLLFSFMGWPSIGVRLISRIALIPVVAGLSYELLRWAGKSDNWFIKVMSIPGLLLQEITTKEPDEKQLQVAIVSLLSVIDAASPCIEGLCNEEGVLLEEVKI